MTTTAKAVSNGSTTTPDKPQRVSGVARVKEARAYHLASIAQDAAYEAQRLCDHIHRAVQEAYLRESHISEAAATLADPAIQDKIAEADRCLTIAAQYLRSMTERESLRDFDQSPF